MGDIIHNRIVRLVDRICDIHKMHGQGLLGTLSTSWYLNSLVEMLDKTELRLKDGASLIERRKELQCLLNYINE